MSNVNEVQAKIVDLLSEYLGDFDSYDDKVSYAFFRPSTVRLSYDGNRLLSKIANSYAFKHELEFKPKHYIAMAHKFKYPFYVSKNYIVLYSEKDAILMSLISDADQFLS
jgi:hypothetical protein